MINALSFIQRVKAISSNENIKHNTQILYDISSLQRVFHYVSHYIFLFYHENSTLSAPHLARTTGGGGGAHPPSKSIPENKPTEILHLSTFLRVSWIGFSWDI